MGRLMRIINFFVIIIWSIGAFAQNEPKLGDLSDGSRTTPVHLIQLIDEDSSVIRMDEQPLLPFSPGYTCGKCHDYEQIKQGWHFNATDTSARIGRPGIPWIYADQQTLTQIPLSFRNWPGVYKPQQIGLTTLQFVQIFGRQMPGGGAGTDTLIREREDLFRWQVSGDLEINCLSCHDGEFAHNPAEYAAQTAKQNFRWAATASSGLAFVRGSAKSMPDNYDLYWGAAPDQPQDLPPQVLYDASRFNYKNEVFFDIVRDIPNSNCYFCHSTKILNSTRNERWQFGEDVHLAAGMKCVDCHRNGLDHRIIRGYEGQTYPPESEVSHDLTCEGCHLKKAEDAHSGISGHRSPRPVHRGIPLVHFDRLTCTACHSGEWPQGQSQRVKTAIIHGLGVKGVSKSDTIIPHIISPVFIEQENGKIAPHNLFWPSFWAVQKGDMILPLSSQIVQPLTKNIIINNDSTGTGNWLNLNDSLLIRVLDSLKTVVSLQDEPVYVSGGEIYRKNSVGKISSQKHPAANPYTWVFAHDVRPAAQSLGKRGCTDCHALNSSLYFGKVEVDTPFRPGTKHFKRMIDFQSETTLQAMIFSFSFLFRPWLKYLVISAVVMIMAVVLLYGFKGLSALVKFTAAEE